MAKTYQQLEKDYQECLTGKVKLKASNITLQRRVNKLQLKICDLEDEITDMRFNNGTLSLRKWEKRIAETAKVREALEAKGK
jgi:uncharacterized protein YlxW (UPF0749 family)